MDGVLRALRVAIATFPFPSPNPPGPHPHQHQQRQGQGQGQGRQQEQEQEGGKQAYGASSVARWIVSRVQVRACMHAYVVRGVSAITSNAKGVLYPHTPPPRFPPPPRALTLTIGKAGQPVLFPEWALTEERALTEEPAAEGGGGAECMTTTTTTAAAAAAAAAACDGPTALSLQGGARTTRTARPLLAVGLAGVSCLLYNDGATPRTLSQRLRLAQPLPDLPTNGTLSAAAHSAAASPAPAAPPTGALAGSPSSPAPSSSSSSSSPDQEEEAAAAITTTSSSSSTSTSSRGAVAAALCGVADFDKVSTLCSGRTVPGHHHCTAAVLEHCAG